MELLVKNRILAGLAMAQVEAHENATRYGYWEKRRSNEEIAGLLHRDVSQVMEIAVGGDSPSSTLSDTTKLEEAIAVVVLRCLDFSMSKKLNIASAVLRKLEYDESLSRVCRKDF